MTIQAIEEQYATLDEAAGMLDVHERTVRRMIRCGELPARLYAGKYFLDRQTVRSFRETYRPVPYRRSGRKGRLL